MRAPHGLFAVFALLLSCSPSMSTLDAGEERDDGGDQSVSNNNSGPECYRDEDCLGAYPLLARDPTRIRCLDERIPPPYIPEPGRGGNCYECVIDEHCGAETYLKCAAPLCGDTRPDLCGPQQHCIAGEICAAPTGGHRLECHPDDPDMEWFRTAPPAPQVLDPAPDMSD